MKSNRPSRGAALVSILVIVIVFILLGISVVGIETSQARYTAWKYNKALTRQAAAAAIRKVEYQLSTQSSWNAGTIDTGEKKAEGSDCYSCLEINEFSKSFCTLTAHAYMKDNAGNRKWESRIRVTMKKNCFDFAALGACTGGTGEEPGVTVKDNSTVEGDVGSFKPANTVAVAIGSSTPAAATDTNDYSSNVDNSGNNIADQSYTKPASSPTPESTASGGNTDSSAIKPQTTPFNQNPANSNTGNQVYVTAAACKINPNNTTTTTQNSSFTAKMSSGKPGKPGAATPNAAIVPSMVGGIGVTQQNNQGSQVAPPSSSSDSKPGKPSTDSSSSQQSGKPSTSSSSTSSSSSSSTIGSTTEVPDNETMTIDPNNPVAPSIPGTDDPKPSTGSDSSKITGNIYIYKDAVVSGNYKNSQLQIVGNDEVSSSYYTIPAGRDYSDVTVQAGKTHTFSSGITTVQNFKALEGSTIKIDARRGPVLIYVKESFSLDGAKFNVDGDARNVIIYGAYDSTKRSGCTVSITNGSQASFLFNGKYSQVSLSGSKFSGSLLSDKVDITNKSAVAFPSSLVKMKSMPEILTWEEL